MNSMNVAGDKPVFVLSQFRTFAARATYGEKAIDPQTRTYTVTHIRAHDIHTHSYALVHTFKYIEKRTHTHTQTQKHTHALINSCNFLYIRKRLRLNRQMWNCARTITTE